MVRLVGLSLIRSLLKGSEVNSEVRVYVCDCRGTWLYGIERFLTGYLSLSGFENVGIASNSLVGMRKPEQSLRHCTNLSDSACRSLSEAVGGLS